MDTNKTQTAEKMTIRTRALHSFAACSCGKRHGHTATETIRRQYIGLRLHQSSNVTGPALATRCECGRNLRWTAVKATKTDHVCDERCIAAKGNICNCSCGGVNHGRG